jgi:hypothetical protein
MWLLNRSDGRTSGHATSDLLERIQRLECEQTELRARLEGERRLRILAARIVGAAQVAAVVGDAVERFAQAMRGTESGEGALAVSLVLEVRGDISTEHSCLNLKSSQLE